MPYVALAQQAVRVVVQVVIILALVGASPAVAVQWVTSPAPVAVVGGEIAAGGNACGFVNAQGDRMLFFGGVNGAWTDLELPETHDVLSIEAAGDIVLVVTADLLVAFDAAQQTAHLQPLQGELLSTSINPSWACGLELAAAVTDEALHVFDARRDGWTTHPYVMPDYQSHDATVAEADYVAVELSHSDFTRFNLAYSLQTGAFAESDPGTANLTQGHLLDHGFAGPYGPWDNVDALGYSAVTGEFNHLDPGLEGESVGGYGVDRKRRELCHLWSLTGTIGDSQNTSFYIWVYDTLTDTWSSSIYTYDNEVTHAPGAAYNGGGFVCFPAQDVASHSYLINYFDGRTHTFGLELPSLPGSNLVRVLGGDVAGYDSGLQMLGSATWWCHGLDHPEGQFVAPGRPSPAVYLAGQDYVSFGARTEGDPRMDVYFYHGPTNTVQSVEMWQTVASQDHAGTHVHALVTYGDDVDIVFYSPILNLVVERSMPAGTYPGRHMGEDLALVFQNGEGDFLFDSRTGVVHSRGCDYSSTSLGQDVVVGVDPDAGTLQAYSALSGQWSTWPVDGMNYAEAGGQVALGHRYDYRRFHGFAGAEDAWADLETASASFNRRVGGRTAIVQDSDRLWALWQDAAISVPDDGAPGTRSLGQAVARVLCHPNPFNGRMNVSFSLPRDADVRIEVFDVGGRKVATLLDERRAAGPVAAVWDTGRAASGVYLVRLEADGRVATRKVALVE